MYGLRCGAFYLPGEAVGAPFHPSPNFTLIGRPASMPPSSSLIGSGVQRARVAATAAWRAARSSSEAPGV